MSLISELTKGLKQGSNFFVRGSGIALGIIVIPLSLYGAVYVLIKGVEKLLFTKEFRTYRKCILDTSEEKSDLLSKANQFVGLPEFDYFYDKYLELDKTCSEFEAPSKWIWSK